MRITVICLLIFSYLFEGVLFILIIALAKPDSSGRRRDSLSACGRCCCWVACSSGAGVPRHCKMLTWTRRRREKVCHFTASLAGDEKRTKPSKAPLLPQARPTSPYSLGSAGWTLPKVPPAPTPTLAADDGLLGKDTAKIVAAKG